MDNLKLKYLPSKELSVLIVICIILMIIFQIIASGFLSFGNIMDMLRQASMLAIISLGLAIVIAGGGIDLSVGHIAGLSATITALLFVNYQSSVVVAISAGLLTGTLMGLLNGVVVSKLGVTSFIATLGTQFIITGIRYWITGGTTLMMLPTSYTVIGDGKILNIPYPVIIMTVILLVGYLIIENTAMGRKISSVGKNIKASWFSGIKIRKYTTLTFVLAGFLSACTGIIIGARQGLVNVNLGNGFLLDALTISVLSAATFKEIKIIGIFVVTILLILLTTGAAMIGFSPSVLNLIKGLLLISAIGGRMFLNKYQ